MTAGRVVRIRDIEHEPADGWGAEIQRLDLPSTSVTYSPDGSLLLIGNGRYQRRLDVLDGRTLEPIRRIETFSGVVAFAPRGDTFATAGRAGSGSFYGAPNRSNRSPF